MQDQVFKNFATFHGYLEGRFCKDSWTFHGLYGSWRIIRLLPRRGHVAEEILAGATGGFANSMSHRSESIPKDSIPNLLSHGFNQRKHGKQQQIWFQPTLVSMFRKYQRIWYQLVSFRGEMDHKARCPCSFPRAARNRGGTKNRLNHYQT